MIFAKSDRPFTNFENAAKSIPKSGGPLKILVFNNQGLPVLQYVRDYGATNKIDERESALGADVVRDLYIRMNDIYEDDPERVALFYDDKVVTLEKDDPFIFLITWPTKAFKVTSSASENYIKRLSRTLHEELT